MRRRVWGMVGRDEQGGRGGGVQGWVSAHRPRKQGSGRHSARTCCCDSSPHNQPKNKEEQSEPLLLSDPPTFNIRNPPPGTSQPSTPTPPHPGPASHLGKPKVAELGVALLVDEHVLWLQVPVHCSRRQAAAHHRGWNGWQRCARSMMPTLQAVCRPCVATTAGKGSALLLTHTSRGRCQQIVNSLLLSSAHRLSPLHTAFLLPCLLSQFLFSMPLLFHSPLHPHTLPPLGAHPTSTYPPT